MEFLIALIIVFLFIGGGILLGLHDDIKNNVKNKKFMKTAGKADLEKITKAMEKLNIPLPQSDPDNLKYLKSCLRKIEKYAWGKIEEDIKKHQLQYKKLSSEVLIIYDSKKVIFPPETILLFGYCINIKSTDNGIIFHRDTPKSIRENITSDKLVSLLNTLDDNSFLKGHSLKWEDCTWYLADVPDSAQRLASIAASATLGGLVFGGIGALGAGMSTNKKEQESDKECRLMFGYKNGPTWQIAKDLNSYSFQENFKFLNEMCPEIRGKDIPKKYK